MNLRITLAAPFPWLVVILGKLFEKRRGRKTRGLIYYLKPPRSLKFTREGTRFLVITLLIGFAAINTGNNLLYLVVAMLLSLIVISGLMSEATLRRVTVERQIPRHVFRATPTRVRLKFENTKRVFSSYSFNAAEAETPALKTEPAYVLKLEGGGKTVRNSTYTFEKRGVFKLDAVKLTTRFPFGLFLKGKKNETPAEVLVYPKLRPVKHPEYLPGASAGSSSIPRKGEGTQLHGLRDYTFSDDSRFIHWRSAARTRKLLTKEFELESERKYMILFENCPDRRKDRHDAARFEQLVEEAASIAGHLIDRGWSVGLRTKGAEVRVSAGRDHLYRILNILALSKPEGPPGSPSVRVLNL